MPATPILQIILKLMTNLHNKRGKMKSIIIVLLMLASNLTLAFSQNELLINESNLTIDNLLGHNEKLDLDLTLIRDDKSPNFIRLYYNKNFFVQNKCRRYSSMHVGNGHIISNCLEYEMISNLKRTSTKINLYGLKKLQAGETQRLKLSIKQEQIGQNVFTRDYVKFSAIDLSTNQEIKIYTKRFRRNTIYLNQ